MPDVIPPQACDLAWQKSLTLLPKPVEAETPEQTDCAMVPTGHLPRARVYGVKLPFKAASKAGS